MSHNPILGGRKKKEKREGSVGGGWVVRERKHGMGNGDVHKAEYDMNMIPTVVV